ncbi:MAG: cation:proton antiporter subunit C [Ignavibacteriae bacterium]|nr:cation:proton antiporter subunit C [Ignavibacteriota bacterium]
MVEYIANYSAYWLIFLLTITGLYGMLVKKNLVKKLIGMTIFQTSVIMFFVASASKWNATIPVVDPNIGSAATSLYINPLPHTLMLTAIVVGVATIGLAFALLMKIYHQYHTLDEPQLLERMR